jgi:hypothetical protein
MCALFGPGVTSRESSLDLVGGQVQTGALDFTPVIQGLGLLAAEVRAGLQAFELDELIEVPLDGDLPLVKPGPDLTVEPLALATHGLGGAPFLLSTVVRTVDAQTVPIVRSDLAFMRGQAHSRRGVPPSRLTEEQLAYWSKRIADSKRIAQRHVKLVAVFPDLPLDGDRPITYRSEDDAIAYHPSESITQTSTVVIARHAITGEAIQGRFYRE